jgi:hypothetical protein
MKDKRQKRTPTHCPTYIQKISVTHIRMRFSTLALFSIITIALASTIPFSAREQACTCETMGTHCGGNALGLRGKCRLDSLYICERGNGALPNSFLTCSHGCVESQVPNRDDTCRISARDLGPRTLHLPDR